MNHEELLRELMAKYGPGDLFTVTALRHCSGLTAPGPDRKSVVLDEGETDAVPWFVARRWLAKKWAEPSDEPEQIEDPEEQIADPEVDDLVQWLSGGQEMWTKRKRIKRIEAGFAFFDGSETGIPLEELER